MLSILLLLVLVTASSATAASQESTAGAFGFRFLTSLSDALQRLESRSLSYERRDTDWGEVTITVSQFPADAPGTPRQTHLTFFQERLYAISTSWTDHPREAYNELLTLLTSKYGRPTTFTAYKARWMIRGDVAILLEIIDEKTTHLDHIFIPLASTASQSWDL